jgi:sugar lactone lactonase YvrE
MRRAVFLSLLTLCVTGVALMVARPACAGPFPKDTIFASDTNTTDHTVVFMISADGKATDFATVPGGVDSGPWIGPLAFSPSGDLYVVTRGNDDNVGALWNITKGGNLASDKPVATGLFAAGGSNKFCGLAFDAAGNAYIANGEADMQPIARVDPTGKVSQLTGEFNRPRGLAVQGDTLYICESANGQVLAYNLKDNTVKPFATGFQKLDDHTAGQLAIDPRGHILVLWKMDPDDENSGGVFDITAGGDFSGKAPLLKPTFRCDMNQMAVDSKNNLYAMGDGGGNMWISRFDGSKFADFVEFATGLGDSEAMAIAP